MNIAHEKRGKRERERESTVLVKIICKGANSEQLRPEHHFIPSTPARRPSVWSCSGQVGGDPAGSGVGVGQHPIKARVACREHDTSAADSESLTFMRAVRSGVAALCYKPMSARRGPSCPRKGVNFRHIIPHPRGFLSFSAYLLNQRAYFTSSSMYSMRPRRNLCVCGE